MRNRGSALAWLFVIACLVAGGWAFARLAETAGAGGAEVPPGSARRYDPWGSAALAETLRRLDVPVRYLERPRLEEGTRGLLVRLPQPAEDSLFDDDPQGVYDLPTGPLLSWVAEGNVLVSAGRAQRDVAEELGVAVERSDAEEAEAVTDHQRQGGPPEDLPGLPIAATLDLSPVSPGAAPRRLRLLAPLGFVAADDRPFAATAEAAGGRVVAAALRHGDGVVVFLGAPDPLQNASIGQADHLALALDLLGAAPPGSAVWFDEWAHGLGHAGSIIEVIVALGLVPLGLQGGVWLLAYAWSQRGRRALRPAPAQPVGGGAVAQAEALGRLVRAHTEPAAAAMEVAAEVRHRIAAALGCAPSAVEARLGETLGAAAARQVLGEAATDAARSVPHCRRCAFPLRGGADTARCPECGEPLSSAQRRVLARGAAPERAVPPRERTDAGPTWAKLRERLAEAAEAAETLAAERSAARPPARRGGLPSPAAPASTR